MSVTSINAEVASAAAPEATALKRVVLAGGSGQVGGILARHFHSRRHNVTVLARIGIVSPWLGADVSGPLAPGTLILFLIVGASNVFRIYQSVTIQEAVILAEKADVLSGPGEDNPTLFSIHEGLKVKVQAELNQWSQISLENGWNGWVKTEALGMI